MENGPYPRGRTHCLGGKTMQRGIHIWHNWRRLCCAFRQHLHLQNACSQPQATLPLRRGQASALTMLICLPSYIAIKSSFKGLLTHSHTREREREKSEGGCCLDMDLFQVPVFVSPPICQNSILCLTVVMYMLCTT